MCCQTCVRTVQIYFIAPFFRKELMMHHGVHTFNSYLASEWSSLPDYYFCWKIKQVIMLFNRVRLRKGRIVSANQNRGLRNSLNIGCKWCSPVIFGLVVFICVYSGWCSQQPCEKVTAHAYMEIPNTQCVFNSLYINIVTPVITEGGKWVAEGRGTSIRLLLPFCRGETIPRTSLFRETLFSLWFWFSPALTDWFVLITLLFTQNTPSSNNCDPL